MEALLQTTKLSRTYNGRSVVDKLEMRLDRGEILGLLGPNGAGKSTTLRMLCGDLAPTAGQIHICSHDLHAEPIAAKLQLGYLPERPPLHPDQRVSEFLIDAARLHRIPHKKINDTVQHAIQRCGLQTVDQRLIRNLSKGFQQRVGIAQAILHQPSVIILDEPTDGLDPAQIREVRELIKSLAKNASVILSSHILPEIQALCHRVIILQDGKTVYSGDISPSESVSLKVLLARPPGLKQLIALPSVAEVKQLNTDYFHLHLKPAADATQLATQIVEQGWGLRELTPETLSLEQIFLQTTTGKRKL